jgi:hypothetical protein
METKQEALDILMMINPDSGDQSGADEALVETDLMYRLGKFGLNLDMRWARSHRHVVKNKWRQARGEF